MNNLTRKDLLNEYETKRRQAILDAENKKQLFRAEHPDFEKLENDFSKQVIEYNKKLITSNLEQKQSIIKELEKISFNFQKEKEKYLKSCGIASNYFDPVFECNICKDTGYVLKNNKSEMCSCLTQKIFNLEYNKSNMGNLEKENFSTFSLSKYSDEVNYEKYHANVSPRENIKNIKKICESFIQNFNNPEEKNLLFTGNTGLGKTFLSNCIAYELLKQGKTVLYQTSPIMLDSIIDYRFDKPGANPQIVENLLNVDLLIIDDLGTETINNMKFTELFNIINTRLLNQTHKITKTIISTNLSLNNIFSIYEERLGSRFVGNYNICRFFGDDIRFMK